MALILPNSAFVHCNKTGGMWVRKALRNAGLRGVESGDDLDKTKAKGIRKAQMGAKFHENSDTVKEAYSDKVVFGFVRDPLTFLKSYWVFRTKNGWLNRRETVCGEIDELRSRWHLNPWLLDISGKYPNVVADMYYKSLGCCDIIRRMEALPNCLIDILNHCGEEYDEEKLRATPKQNVSIATKLDVIPMAREAIRKSQEEAYKIWIEARFQRNN